MRSDLGGAGAGVQGVVHVVGDVGGEAPVVAAVLEQVGHRHGGVGEPVDEQRLEDPLAVVEHPGPGCQLLGQPERSRALDIPVGEPRPGVEPKVNQKRACPE